MSHRLESLFRPADEVQQEWKTLLLYRNWAMYATGAALLLVGAVVLLVNAINWYFGNLTSNPFDFYLLGRVFVVAAIIVLALLWISSGTTEYGYLTTWIRTPTLRSRRPQEAMLSFFMLAAFFTILIIVSGSVHGILLLYCLYLVVDIYTVILRRAAIGAGIEGGKEFLSAIVPSEGEGENSREIERDRSIVNLYARSLQALRSYYFDRYHITRIVATLAAMGLLYFTAHEVPRGAFGLVHVDPSAAKLTLKGLSVPFDVARFVAYLLFLFIILASELVIASWRSALRVELKEVGDALGKLNWSI